jgi:hypothetical protein
MVRIGIAFFAPTRCEKMGRMRSDLPAMPEMVAATHEMRMGKTHSAN